MKRKLIFSIIMSSLLAAMSLTGCASKKGSDSISNAKVESASQTQGGKKATLELWMYQMTPDRNQVMEGILKKFKDQNPNIEVNYLGIPGSSTDAKNKLDMAYAANTAPDVHNVFLAQYAANDFLAPMDDYFKSWSEKDNISQGSIDSVRTFDQKGGKLYGIPYFAQVKNFWIRSDWFKQANLEKPQTWEQFFDATKKLTDKSKGVYGHSIRGGGGCSENLTYLMYSYSGITEAFTADGKSTINDPLNIEFVQRYVDLYNVYTPQDDLSKGWTELAATFQSGKTAMVFHNLGSADSNEKAFNSDYSKFELMLLPKSIKGSIVHPSFQPEAFCMSKSSNNKDAAWKLIQFLTTGESASLEAKFYGGVPVHKTAADADWIKQKPYMKTAASMITDKTVKYYQAPYYLPDYANVNTKFAEPLMQQAMTKKITVKQFMDQWAAEMTKAKANYDANNKK